MFTLYVMGCVDDEQDEASLFARSNLQARMLERVLCMYICINGVCEEWLTII